MLWSWKKSPGRKDPSDPQCYLGADKSLARPDSKKSWKVATFRPTRRSLLPRRPGWRDNLLNCSWVACKSCNLVSVICLFPGRAKHFSAPRYVFPSVPVLLSLIPFLCLLIVKPDQLEINEGWVILIAVRISYDTRHADCWYSKRRMH